MSLTIPSRLLLEMEVIPLLSCQPGHFHATALAAMVVCSPTALFLAPATNTLMFTKQSLTCPKSSAFFPAKAPGVSTNVMMGNPNLSACFMKRRALR